MDIYVIPSVSSMDELDDVISRAMKNRPEPLPPSLSPREQEILQALADGQTGREIAANLGITHNTLRTHENNIRRKLGVKSLVHAVAIGIRRRTIS